MSGIYNEIPMNNDENNTVENASAENLPTKVGMWGKIKAFFLQEIKVELTPAQQQFQDDLNDFLHIELTWKDFHDFLFQDITFGKKKNVK